MNTGYQCGGIGWTGATLCPSGWYCSVLNAYYSQCLQGTVTTTTTTPTGGGGTTTTTATGGSTTLAPGYSFIRAVVSRTLGSGASEFMSDFDRKILISTNTCNRRCSIPSLTLFLALLLPPHSSRSLVDSSSRMQAGRRSMPLWRAAQMIQ